jgi:undecaprenyl-diphosphatase
LTALAALVLGIVQGATEFLPVSSSAHLALLHWITGWTHSPTSDLTFDVALHFGTLLAILIYFGRDWLDYLKRRDKLVAYLLVACIPGALAGVALEDAAATVFRNPLSIAAMLALMGLAMGAAEWLGKRVRDLPDMGWKPALTIGLAQALAIMPGVSRAGATISTGVLLGFTREAAARFSFLLATPLLLGATLWQCRHLLSGGLGLGAMPLLIGVLASGLTGLACIHFLLRFLRRHTLYPFVVYRLALAAAVVVVALIRGH